MLECMIYFIYEWIDGLLPPAKHMLDKLPGDCKWPAAIHGSALGHIQILVSLLALKFCISAPLIRVRCQGRVILVLLLNVYFTLMYQIVVMMIFS